MLPKVRARAGQPVATDFSSADGSPLVQNNETGEWFGYANGSVTPLQLGVYLEGFGAKGDGTTDDTQAFLDFQTYAQSLPDGYTAVLNLRAGKVYTCTDPYWSLDIRKLIVNGNGAIIKNTATVNKDKSLLNTGLGTDKDALGTFYSPVDSYLLNTTTVGATSVTTTTAAQAGNFAAGDFALIASFDQQFAGQPPNFRYFEYVEIVSAVAGTGVITLDRKLRYEHRSDFPYLSSYANGDGRARIYRIEQGSLWNVEHVYNDIEFRKNDVSASGAVAEAVYITGRRVTLNRCIAPYFLPTVVERCTLTDCTQSETGEVDKLVDLMEFNGGTYWGQIDSATSCNNLRAVGTNFYAGYDWNPKNLELINCNVKGTALIKGAYGYTEGCLIRGGSHESLPSISLITTQTRSVTIGATGVSWSAPVLTVTGLGTQSLLNFVAGCFVGQVIHVTESVLGADISTGVVGYVTAITGSDSTATISINFSETLAGTEQLTIWSEPHDVRIEDVAVADTMISRDYIRLPRKRYAVKKQTLTSAQASGTIYCMGRPVRLMVDVLRPYTGATGGNILLAFNSTFPGASGDRLNYDVDLKTTGRREATCLGNAGWTGAAGETAGTNLSSGDLGDTFIGSFTWAASTMAGAVGTLPIVSFELVLEDTIYRE